ncbi:hypothetical protein LIER_38195 [Lithospermum erythrorhizon]|uniref:Uncharacterized protein n=1 Tax=Lithospermum erythrorhizon TaxID=34254 RepID=A0AAV3PY80_LITER
MKRQRSRLLSERKRKTREGGKSEERDGGGGDDEDDGNSSDLDYDEDLKRMRANFEELCDEDKIFVFFKKLLNEWNRELDEMTETEKRSAKGNFAGRFVFSGQDRRKSTLT